jgi:hypothetical protein
MGYGAVCLEAKCKLVLSLSSLLCVDVSLKRRILATIVICAIMCVTVNLFTLVVLSIYVWAGRLTLPIV